MILRNHTGLSRFLGLCATLCLFAVLLGCQQAPAGSAGSSDSTGSSDSIQTPESTAGSASSGSTGSANTADTGGLPDSGRIAALEALYGQGKETVLEALEVTEDAEAQRPVRGMWSLQDTAALQGVGFSQALLYNAADETLYGLRYWYRTDDPDQTVQLAQGLLEESRELYGEPTTYPGLSNLLSDDTFADDFAAAMAGGSMADWKEEWAVGENTLCTVSVSVIGPDTATIFVDYSLAV